MGERRRISAAGRMLITDMTSAGQSVREVSTALERDGHGRWSERTIRKYRLSAEPVMSIDRGDEVSVDAGATDRSSRLQALIKRADWIAGAIDQLSVGKSPPALFKTLLSEFREYSKLVSQELGYSRQACEEASGVRSIALNLTLLTGEELALLRTIRMKLEERNGAS